MNTRARNLNSGGGTARSVVKTWPALVILLLFAALSTARVFAQSYAIDWHTIDGGGGTSTNGPYSLTGAIGQGDASGSMTNAQYSLTGGIWVLPVMVQEPSVPVLTVVPAAPGFALISWTPDTPGFVLQESLALTPPAWTNSPSGAVNPVTVPATLPAKFYRLQK
jgi:hypothetical protein